MLKLTVHYDDEQELRSFMQIVRPYISSVKPSLDKPSAISSQSVYKRRAIRIKTLVTNRDQVDE